MSEQRPHYPGAEIQELYEITKRPEYAEACKNVKRGGDLFRELLKLGVPKTEVEKFALARLEKNIRAGYGLDTARSIVEQSGVVTRTEVDAFFEKIKVKMSVEIRTDTGEENRQKADRELEETLKLYE